MRAYAFRVELSGPDYLALLNAVPKGSALAVPLIGAIGLGERFVFISALDDALSLRMLALLHAPDALQGIDRELAAMGQTL